MRPAAACAGKTEEPFVDQVTVEFSEGLAILTLDNPRQKNAISHHMALEIVAACEEVDGSDAGAMVLRGAGGYFCSGAQRAVLESVAEDPVEDERYAALTDIYESFMRVGRVKVPVFAAVRGGAVGAGLNLALAADVRIVASGARLSSGFSRLGLHPGGGHAHLLSTLANAETAVAMGVVGLELTGEEAVARGLAWMAVDDAAVEETAISLASRAAADPRLSRAMIQGFRRHKAQSWADAAQAERAPQMWSLTRLRVPADQEPPA